MPRTGVALLAIAGIALGHVAAYSVQGTTAREPPADRFFEVTAKRFEFIPDRLEVTEGERVTLAIRSADTAHGIELKKLGLKREIPRGGDAISFTFAPPSAGTYEITCSEYCGRGHERMRARLIVRPKPAEERR